MVIDWEIEKGERIFGALDNSKLVCKFFQSKRKNKFILFLYVYVDRIEIIINIYV